MTLFDVFIHILENSDEINKKMTRFLTALKKFSDTYLREYEDESENEEEML